MAAHLTENVKVGCGAEGKPVFLDPAIASIGVLGVGFDADAGSSQRTAVGLSDPRLSDRSVVFPDARSVLDQGALDQRDRQKRILRHGRRDWMNWRVWAGGTGADSGANNSK